MVITKEMLKAEIDKIPESYFGVAYRIIRALSVPLDLVLPFQHLPEDTPTSEQVVAKIQSLPKDSANIELATKPLADGLNSSCGLHDPSFDVQAWNQQWDEFETKMKQEELEHETLEQQLNG